MKIESQNTLATIQTTIKNKATGVKVIVKCGRHKKNYEFNYAASYAHTEALELYINEFFKGYSDRHIIKGYLNENTNVYIIVDHITIN